MDGEPEPDGFIARGQPSDYVDRHPGPADLALVIEVSDATLRGDRTGKLRSYARAGVPIYWIVNVIDRQIEAYSDPDPLGTPHPSYRDRRICTVGDAITVSVGGTELGPIAVALIVPPNAH